MQNHLSRTSLVAVFVSSVFVLSACADKKGMRKMHMEMQTREQAQSDAISRAQKSSDAAQAAAEAAMAASQKASADAESVRRSAEHAAAMAEQNQAALRILNDKIDRMFATMSRK